MPERTLVGAAADGIRERSFVRSSLHGLLLSATVCPVHWANTAQSAERNPAEPGWLPVVVATGDLQTQIEAMPIESRPYRPLHFYGNTVRRMHYRGTPLPRVGEVLALPVRVISPGARTTRSDRPKATKENRSASRGQ